MIANDCINLANIVFRYAMPNLLPDAISATTATGVERMVRWVGAGRTGRHLLGAAANGRKLFLKTHVKILIV